MVRLASSVGKHPTLCVFQKKYHNLRYFFELTSFCVQRCFSGSASASLHPSNPKKNSNHPRAKRPSQYHIPDPHQTPATYLGETDVFVRVFCFKVLFIKPTMDGLTVAPVFLWHSKVCCISKSSTLVGYHPKQIKRKF